MSPKLHRKPAGPCRLSGGVGCLGGLSYGHRSISPGHSFQEGSRIYNNKGFVKVNQVGLHCGTLHHTGPHTGNHFPCGNRLSAHGWHHSSMCIAPWKGTPPNLHVPTTIMSMFHAYHSHHSTSPLHPYWGLAAPSSLSSLGPFPHNSSNF